MWQCDAAGDEDGFPILQGVNLTIRAGEVHAIMGTNGSGKSTLSKVLVGHPDYEVTGGSGGQHCISLSRPSLTPLASKGSLFPLFKACMLAHQVICIAKFGSCRVHGESSTAWPKPCSNALCKNLVCPAAILSDSALCATPMCPAAALWDQHPCSSVLLCPCSNLQGPGPPLPGARGPGTCRAVHVLPDACGDPRRLQCRVPAPQLQRPQEGAGPPRAGAAGVLWVHSGEGEQQGGCWTAGRPATEGRCQCTM